MKEMARVTGLEPATSGVTGRHSNQLSYTRAAMYVRFLDYLKSLDHQHFSLPVTDRESPKWRE